MNCLVDEKDVTICRKGHFLAYDNRREENLCKIIDLHMDVLEAKKKKKSCDRKIHSNTSTIRD